MFSFLYYANVKRIAVRSRRLLNMRTNNLLLVLFLFLRQEVRAQDATASGRPVLNPLALGGMVQGLLGMQIRPEGGFYEERYKDIFHDEANVPLANNDERHSAAFSTRKADILKEDGKLLTDAAQGKSPNPCFDLERIARNRLLLLVCSLQQLNQQTSNNHV